MRIPGAVALAADTSRGAGHASVALEAAQLVRHAGRVLRELLAGISGGIAVRAGRGALAGMTQRRVRGRLVAVQTVGAVRVRVAEVPDATILLARGRAVIVSGTGSQRDKQSGNCGSKATVQAVTLFLSRLETFGRRERFAGGLVDARRVFGQIARRFHYDSERRENCRYREESSASSACDGLTCGATGLAS